MLNLTDAFPPHRHTVRALLAAMAFVLATCTDAPPTAPDVGSQRGTVMGSVTLLGNDGPDNPSGRLTLHSSQEDLQFHRAKYTAVLFRRDGAERRYDFVLSGVAPGSYYVLACFSIGCGPYQQPETGTLIRISVTARHTTIVRFGL